MHGDQFERPIETLKTLISIFLSFHGLEKCVAFYPQKLGLVPKQKIDEDINQRLLWNEEQSCSSPPMPSLCLTNAMWCDYLSPFYHSVSTISTILLSVVITVDPVSLASEATRE